ncbi:NUDIX hydrolase [Arenibaculum pallidiluteum]|uniref:NUDIX hydrolase n=1 Tax=Arenibaculum pallidiluteum TaxID=2812559 RepID=UPI001A96B1E5|nr:NUDIX hydrolase [Arenibaculum pallidiluteum]
MSPEPPRGPFVRAIPAGDDRQRLVCPDCGFVNYENPKIVVGSVASWEDRILLCRRAIEPSRGLWTLPAGFMEMNETSAGGAAREAWEEARARIEIDCLLAVYDLPWIGQVQMIFRARLLAPDVSAGPESLEVGLFPWDEIPRAEIAFPTVGWALDAWRARRGTAPGFAPAANPEAGPR